MCQTNSFKLVLLQVVGLLGLLVLCLWLSLRPKTPNFTIMDLSVPTSTNPNASSPCSHSIYYILEIKNQNKDSSVYYDDIFLTFYYGQQTVGNNKIPSFHQGKAKTKEVMDHVDPSDKVWKALAKSISNSTAKFKVALSSRLRYKTVGIWSKHHALNLEGNVQIGSDGKISNKKTIKLHDASKKWRVKALH